MEESKMVNGIDVTALAGAIHEFQQDPALCAFEFRIRNKWQGGSINRSTVESFYGAKQENDGRTFVLTADEPELLLGSDEAPNPVEMLLSSLASCMTTSMVYHAAARGISIEECHCELSGEIDVRGFFGFDESVRKGYDHIDVMFHVRSDADARALAECARMSPVLDVVSHGTRVNLEIEALTPVVRTETVASADRSSDEPGTEAHPGL